MIWSKIKKAINSTLGTSGFKPLDKIITDSFGEVVEKQNKLKGSLESGDNDFIVKFAKSSANIEVGSYVGTGTYGKDYPNSLTFPFVPKLVIIMAEHGGHQMVFVNGVQFCVDHSTNASVSAYENAVDWDGNTVSWYYTASYKEDEEGNPIYTGSKSDFQLNGWYYVIRWEKDDETGESYEVKESYHETYHYIAIG